MTEMPCATMSCISRAIRWRSSKAPTRLWPLLLGLGVLRGSAVSAARSVAARTWSATAQV